MIFASKSTLVFSGETGIPYLLQCCYHLWGEKKNLNRPHFPISISPLGLLSTCKAHIGTKYKCVNWSNEKVTISRKLNYNNNNDPKAVEDKKDKFKYQKNPETCFPSALPIIFLLCLWRKLHVMQVSCRESALWSALIRWEKLEDTLALLNVVKNDVRKTECSLLRMSFSCVCLLFSFASRNIFTRLQDPFRTLKW